MKYKGSNKKLTRLILTALFLNSSIYLPVAEAETYTIPGANIDSSASPGSPTYYFPKSTLAAEGDMVQFKDSSSSTYASAAICGGYAGGSAALSKRHLEMFSGSGKVYTAYGAYNYGAVSYSSVTLNGGTVIKYVAGGYSNQSTANNNTVTINNFTADPTSGDSFNVYGGLGTQASDNKVIINGGNFTRSSIYGAYGSFGGAATNNTVEINDNFSGTIEYIYGGRTTGSSTNNALVIGKSGINVGAANVLYTQVLKVGNGIAFAPNTVLFTTTGVITKGNNSAARPDKIDIAGLTVGTAPALGEMTLFKGGGTTDFTGIKVVRQNGTTEQTVISSLSATAQKVSEDDEDTDEKATEHPDVAFTYRNVQKMYVKNNTDIMFKNSHDVSNVTLGTVAWNSTTPARTVTADAYYFDGNTAIDPSNLTFSGTAAFTVDPLASGGQSMKLLSGATGITATHIGTLGDAGVVNTKFTSNEMTLYGTTKGALSVSSGDVKYTLNSGTLTSVNLAGWTGTGITLNSGWSSGLGDNSITASGFTNPNTTRDIITAKAGFFNNDQITGNQKYSEGTELVDDIAKGVTINGYKTGGVRVKEGTNGATLEFAAGAMDGRTIKLGDMTFGDGRTVDNSYNFANTTTVDASNLNFTGFKSPATADSIGQGSTTTLLSGGQNLTSNISVTGTPHSQDISFTNAKGVKLSGTLTGDVATDAGKVDYTVSAKTLNKVDLTDWDGTDAGTVTASWEAPASGEVAVDTGNFTATPGDVDILTLTSGTFGSITGAKAYTEGGAFSGDTDKGVTLSGTKAGGVRAKTTDAKTLEFVSEKRNPQSITLGDMTFGDGRTVDTSYNFANTATVDASKLNFTGFKSPATADSIGQGSTTILLSGGQNLTSNISVTGTPRSQDISFTNAKGVKLSGTLTGDVTTATGEVDYTVSAKTLNKVDLTDWDGTDAGTVTATWTAPTSGSVAVDTGNFTVTPGSTNILTLANGTFGSITGDKAYTASGSFSGDTVKGVTLAGTREGGVRANTTNAAILEYVAETKKPTSITLGNNMTWKDGRAADASYDFTNVTSINASNLKFTNYASGYSADTIKATDTMALLSDANNLSAGTAVTGASNSQDISFTNAQGIKLSGTLTGTVSTSNTAGVGQVDYMVDGKTLEKLDLSSWTGAPTTTVDVSWQPPAGGQIAVDTGSFTPPTTVAPGTTIDIFTAPTGTTFGTVTGTRTYKDNEPFKDPAKSGVTLEGVTSGGIQTADSATKLTYTGIGNTVSKITLGKITSPTATFGNEYSFTGASVDDSGLSFENPENIGNGDNVTLFTSANSSLTPAGSTDKTVSYSTTPVTGVTLNGQITGSYSNTNSTMTYSATANNAQKLTFGNVEWKDTEALIDHSTTLTKVNFDGANVDTSNINFTNIKELEANKQMTLVSNYGGTPGSITGSKYKVGSTLQGEGKASMDGDNLIFTADTTAEKMEVQEQTHNTLMGASATMTSLAQGNEFINTTMDDMFLGANVGRDGIASYAHIGGGSLRQETGSHVNTHTWNAIVAFGHQNKKPRNTFEYGAFAEYGTGNFTTYNGDLRGDGSSRYVGGGVLAKWTAPSGLYVEGSVRAGSVHEDGSNLLQDINGVPYSYSTDTPYYGVHLGVGKKIPMKGGSVLDVYARYFYNHRNSTSFDAGGHYDLDAITSQIIRVGARYTVKRDKWNYYGGLAYEHELDGKAGGWADGLAIRGVDTSGGSFRAELGATVTPNEDIPLTLDFHITGFAGKKQGLFGGMGLKFNF